jgi:hypothetical protein
VSSNKPIRRSNKGEPTQRRCELASEQAANEAQLSELHHCKTTLETARCVTVDLPTSRAQARDVATAINHNGLPRLAFTGASQNMAAAVTLLDTLRVPSTNRVGRVYHQLNGQTLHKKPMTSIIKIRREYL